MNGENCRAFYLNPDEITDWSSFVFYWEKGW